jgi:hypothetical protein
VSFALLTFNDQLGGTGQILPLHVFLDVPRRTAQERVPIASNVGSREVTWASSPHLLSPFASFRVFRGPHSLGKAGTLTGPRAECHVWLRPCRAAGSYYGAASIIKRCCPAETGENSLHNTEWTLPPRVAQTCISIFIDSTIATG